MHNLRRQKESSQRLEAQKVTGKQRKQAYLRQRRKSQMNHQIPAKTQKRCRQNATRKAVLILILASTKP